MSVHPLARQSQQPCPPARRPGVDAPRPRAVVDEQSPPTWGWALVEIRADGTWGEPRVIPAPTVVDPPGADVRATAALTGPSSITELSELLKTHLAAGQVAAAGRGEVAEVLAHGAVAAPAGTRSRFLGPLAHVEALQGDLRRAERHATQTLSDPVDPHNASGRAHALLAQAWVALERADFYGARRYLDTLDDGVRRHDSWLATSHLLLDAKLLIVRGAPEAAIRLLAVRGRAVPSSDWLSDLVTVVRAEALIASGEPHRAMALLTPAPRHAVVEAMVMAALARRMIGDARGALAVLGQAVVDLDHAPLALQVEAWLLEARMAEDQQRHERAGLLVDRALRSATGEGMRRVVMRDWGWLRRTVERDPELSRRHREFLATCQFVDGGTWTPASTPPSPPTVGSGAGQLLPPVLTTRESQVLELLAQMNSTEEIAAALFVSTNTIKTHCKGIFVKLGVNRRVEAVRRGQALGLC